MKDYLDLLTIAAAVGSGLVAGIFFAFSSFVMEGLRRIPSEQGMAAMQSINVTVLNPSFFSAFFGTALLCLPIAFLAWRGDAGGGRAYLLAACALYLLGTILVTIIGNVPLNDQLAAMSVDHEAASALWSRYCSRWILWNHVRTAASAAAMILFVLTLWRGSGSG